MSNGILRVVSRTCPGLRELRLRGPAEVTDLGVRWGKALFKTYYEIVSSPSTYQVPVFVLFCTFPSPRYLTGINETAEDLFLKRKPGCLKLEVDLSLTAVSEPAPPRWST